MREHVHDDGTVHKGADEEGHTYGEGPLAGVVADWGGGKFHVEFTVDHAKQEAVVYILGDDEKTASPIDAAEVTLPSRILRLQSHSKPARKKAIRKAKPHALWAITLTWALSKNTKAPCRALSMAHLIRESSTVFSG